MDHRAVDAGASASPGRSDAVLRHVGGIISPEMETPKLLWLKENLPATFDSGRAFLRSRRLPDLARDRQPRRARPARVTCKWTYLAHEQRGTPATSTRSGWPSCSPTRARQDRPRDRRSRHGDRQRPERRGGARDLGLEPGTPVGAGLIDAHAGGVGTIGGQGADGAPIDVRERLAYVMGTSACIMATTETPCFVPGVWGPYYSAMVPGLWLNEGGQSATGAAIDHLVRSHPGLSGTGEPRRRLQAWRRSICWSAA